MLFEVPFGWAFAMASVMLYLLSFYQFKKGKDQWATVFIALAGGLIFCWSAADGYLHQWDEQFHALVAKNLSEDPLRPMLYSQPLVEYDYTNWTQNHIWLHKQPFSLWTMALSIKVFGANAFAVRFPSFILFLAAVFVLFRLSRWWFGREVAYASTVLFSFDGLLIEVGSGRGATDHPDLFFCVFVLFSVFAIAKAFKFGKPMWHVIGGLFLGIAILCKWLPALVVVLVWWSLAGWRFNIAKAQHFLAFIGTALIIAVPWQWYILSAFPQEALQEYAMNSKHLYELIEGRGGNVMYDVSVISNHVGQFAFPALFLFFFTLKNRWAINRNQFIGLICWITIPLLFFSIAKTKMPAYTLLSLPAWCMILGLVFTLLRNHIAKAKPKKAKWLLPALAVILFAPSARFTVERMKLRDHPPRIPAWWSEIEKYQAYPPKTVVFNHPRAIQLMFFTDVVAYDTDIAEADQEKLRNEGWKLIDVINN